MTNTALSRGVAVALLVTVASQLFYIGVVSNSENELLRPITWFTELLAFGFVSVGAYALVGREPQRAFVWSAIGFSGVLNVLQVGMGLSMFAPAREASEAVPQLFTTVLAGAFFFYFFAKLLIGGAAMIEGARALRLSGGLQKAIGGISILTGVAAIAVNLLAMIDSESWTFPAGAAGTAATAFLAAALFILRPADREV